MNLIRPHTLTALLMATAAPAYAEEAAKAAADDSAATAEASDQTIVVTGQRAEYGVRSTSTATRTNTIIRNIPQALTVISESQIEDQGLRSIAELLTFVPGATPGTGEGNRDQITLRGNNTTADFFVDGLRDDVQYFRDLYNVDRVEVLRGSNAMIFGRGGGGGVVNRVTKRSSLSPFRELTASSGSEGGARFSADLDQPLGSVAGIRINGVYENGDSFRRHVDLERYAINPTVGFLAGPNTRLDLSYEYLRDRRTADRGVPAEGNRPLEGFDDSFFGDPDRSSSKANVHLAMLGVEHGLGEGLTLRNRTLFGDYDKFYQNIYPSDLVEATRQVRLAAYNDTTTRRNLLTQTDLTWDNRLGGIDQTLLFGFELGRQTGDNHRRNGVFSTTGSGSILVPADAATVDVPVSFTGGGAHNGMKSSIAAIYAQSQLRPADWLEVVAGLRFDRFSLDIDNRNNGRQFSRTDDLVSPRLGLILKPRQNLSLYTSYSRSYLPQSGDQFNSLDVTAEALKPEKFDNYEFGGKWEPFEGLLATAAVYQLDRANTRAPGSTPGTVVLTGAQRSRGLELGLERSISDRWQISAGYALQKAEITRTTSAAPEGREVPLVPLHQFSLWNRYNVSDAVGVGLGLIARSKSYASVSNAVKLPGYSRVDAALFYELGRGIEAQLNLENLFDADYFPTAHNDNNIAPGAPRTLRATVRAGF